MIENHEDINERAFWGTLGIVTAALFGLGILALALFLSAETAPAGPFWRSGQLAQVDPADREWLGKQLVPGANYRCCDENDGTYAEEEIRGERYWVRFAWRHYGNGDHIIHDADSGWMEVPEAAVIHDANRHGAPVVWWSWQGGYGDQAKVFIRCFAPGGGV